MPQAQRDDRRPLHLQARADAGRGVFTPCSRAAGRSCTQKIARVIEQRFPNLKTTEPKEVLAHHLTAANLAEAAIPLWQADWRALSR